MHYLQARLKEYMDELVYRVYITDSIKGYLQLKERYYDLINPKPKKIETRSAEEIIDHIKSGINGISHGSNETPSLARA